MKKILIIMLVIVSILITIPFEIKAYQIIREKGEWGDWWDLSNSFGKIRRIYDKENKLVCWIYSNGWRGGIDCESSLELEHPLTQK